MEFVRQQMQTALMTLTSCGTNDIGANSRKNPLEAWQRLQKRCDPTIISPGRCSLLELQSGIVRRQS